MISKQEFDSLWKPMPSGCWEWIGSRDVYGYGRIKRNGQTSKAHRLSFEFAGGAVPSDRFVCHKCDNPCCVNPAHLFLGTSVDNNKDRHSKGRTASGEGHTNARLDTARVIRIRERYASGETSESLGREYLVHPSQILKIVNRRQWKHI